MTKGIWRRQWINGVMVAVPADERSRKFLAAVKEGAEFIADTRAARNVKQLRLWWGLMRLLADNIERYGDDEVKASDHMKIALNHVETFLDHKDRLMIVPASIAFESMAQAEFHKLLTQAIDKTSEWLESAPETVRAEFEAMTADNRGYEEMMR